MTVKTIKRTLIRQVKHVRQIENEPFRKWYASRTFDLIVWFKDKSRKVMLGFQLCYKSDGSEKALTWKRGRGFTHKAVDDGESGAGAHKMTPVLIPGGEFDKTRIVTGFRASSSSIEKDLRDEILKILEGYPASRPLSAAQVPY